MSGLLAVIGRFVSLFVLVLTPAAGVFAHEGGSAAAHEPRLAWSLEPEIMLPMIFSAWLYGRGVRQLWRESAVGRGIRAMEASAFAAGWLVLVIALGSPLDALGNATFAAHMIQHEVLMLIAAPLLVLGRPLVPFLWALPFAWRRRVGRWGRLLWVQGGWRTLTRPSVAWATHGIVLWVWHVPELFQAALAVEWIHVLQHVSFLVSALIFWWALVHGREGAMGYGAATLYMFTTAVHTSILGALLTFAPTVWYPAYADTAPQWGLTALEDQQLGGLIMWVPGGAVYVLAGLAFMAQWLRESERRARQRDGYILRDWRQGTSDRRAHRWYTE